MATTWHQSGENSPNSMQDVGYVLTREQAAYDSNYGTTWEQEFQGRGDVMDALAAGLSAAGAKVRWEYKPGINTLTALWARNPNVSESSEVPTDTWRIENEPYQIPLFRHPLVAIEAQSYVSGSFAQYRKDITDAAEGGLAYPLSTTSFPLGFQVYLLLGQGTEYWETQRPVIQRQRTFAKTYIAKYQPRFTSDVYTRSRLISASAGFEIPADFRAIIPADPTYLPPSGTDWGWRLRQQASGYSTQTGKWEETMDFEFGWWHNSLYNILR